MRKLHLLFVAALLCNDMIIAQETDAGSSTTKTPVSRYSEPLTTVLKKIHQQYNINCLYEEKVVNGKYILFTKEMQKEKDPERLLRSLLAPLSLDVVKLDDKNYSIISLKKNAVTVSPVENTSSSLPVSHIITPVAAYTNYKPAASPADTIIRGRIFDEKMEPLAGTSVLIKGTKIGTTTDKFGMFALKVPSNAKTLVIDHVGYKSSEIPIDRNNSLTVKMSVSNKAMEDVVVTGMYTRKVESFTGAATVYSAAQLKTIGNQNIVQSLKTLDPAFIIVDNNALGSNPNALPNIEIRGKTGIAGIRDGNAQDPNQPLFILDGFETDMRTVLDLDMNRVANVTILKDAASTALYGSRASNGVVVIETKRPREGKLNLAFTYDNTVEMPDLSDYNLMNATEKLEFERLSGKYISLPNNLLNPGIQVDLDKQYNDKMNNILRGVNSYWLNEPLQMGLHNNFSLYVDGGDKNVTYGIGAKYGRVNGVMKGSGRTVGNANIDLGYRNAKWNIANKFFFSSYTADESPYGLFSDFSRANPYYEKSTDLKYLEPLKRNQGGDTVRVSNPLYEATIGNKTQEKQINLREQLAISYMLLPTWKMEARAAVTKNITENEAFVSAKSARFDTIDFTKRGSYKHSRKDYLQYESYLQSSYGQVFNQIHELNAVAGVMVSGEKTVRDGYAAEGFPEATVTSPAFGNAYPQTGKPSYSRNIKREMSAFLNAHYGLRSKYLADFNYRKDGASVFGSNRRYKNTWTVGLAWNLHNEHFFRQFTWFNQFKIRASIGNPSNQDVATSYNSYTTFNYNMDASNRFGNGITAGTWGNPELQWPETLDKSIGADINMFKGRFSLRVSFFDKTTDPLAVSVDNAASTGETSYTTNIGTLTNKGFEFQLSAVAVSVPEKRFFWRINAQGINIKATYGNMGAALESMNKQNQTNKSLQRYYDGGSPEDLWAVRSLGIDPATGKEVFFTTNGEPSMVYNSRDVIVAGNSRPDLLGVVGTSVQYGGLSVSLNMRYSVGGDQFNEALFNKVENINTEELAKNQDKRALYDRWRKAGDIATFKKIQLNDGWTNLGQAAADPTQPSSRFVQKNNFITGESISLSYQFDNKWVSKFGLSNLQISGYMNEIFRVSSIKDERGIDYPFARSVSFSVRTNF
jgi:TonB-linked SusC/RagA family outer membrane protein